MVVIEQGPDGRWWVSKSGWGRPAASFKDAQSLAQTYYPDEPAKIRQGLDEQTPSLVEYGFTHKGEVLNIFIASVFMAMAMLFTTGYGDSPKPGDSVISGNTSAVESLPDTGAPDSVLILAGIGMVIILSGAVVMIRSEKNK